MALSHKDWELPNSQIWLAETDIKSSLDFRILTSISRMVTFCSEKLQTKCKIIDYFHLEIVIGGSATKSVKKSSKEDEQTLAELNSAHRSSQANVS